MNKKSQLVGMKGFSLIELMIGITLGLLIMTALVTLFVNTSRTNTEMAKVNSQIENGRFAMQLLENEIVHGGFWGGFVPEFDDITANGEPGDEPTAAPGPCTAYASWDTVYKTNLIGIPVQSYDAVPAGCAVSDTPPGPISNKKANTDVVLIRHAATCSLEWDTAASSWEPASPNCDADTAGKLYFQTSQCETDIEAGNRWVIDDDPDGDSAEYPLLKRGCIAGDFADKRKYVSHIYYIRDFAVDVGDGIPALMRAEFDESGGTLAHQSAQPLINGIEGFRIEFGIDDISDDGFNIITDASHLYTAAVQWADPDNLNSPQNRGDGSPDRFKRCTTADPCSTAELSHVVAVKIYVLARADTATQGYEDNKTYKLGSSNTICSTNSTDSGCVNKTLAPGFKRHVFSTTVRLNNVSGRRETP